MTNVFSDRHRQFHNLLCACFRILTCVHRPHPPREVGATVSEGEDDTDAGQLLLTLPDALAFLVAQHPQKGYLVEVKGGDVRTAPLLARDLAASGATPQQARVIGFDLATMKAVKQCLPHYHCSHVVHQGEGSAAEEVALSEACVHAAADAGMDSIDFTADPESVSVRTSNSIKTVEDTT